MTFSRSRMLMTTLFGLLWPALLGSAQAQVGAQVAPILEQSPFKEAQRGPAGTYVLPGNVSVILNQNKGFLLAATVLTKYEASAGLTVSGGTGAAQASSAQGVSGPDSGLARAASAIGVLSGFGEGMAQPLLQFLTRPDVSPQLERGFNIRADPFTIDAKTEGSLLKLSIRPTQIAPEAFMNTTNARPAKQTSARPVVVRVYSDFQCPFCQRFELETLPGLLAKLPDDVRIEFHHFPLESIHPLARPSAEASECAAQQGVFWAYKDLLFTDRSWLSTPNPNEVFLRLASRASLNTETFQKCLDTRAGKGVVDAGLSESMRLGLNGTPTVFVNGFRSASPYDVPGLLRLIDFARVVPAPVTPAPVTPPAKPNTP